MHPISTRLAFYLPSGRRIGTWRSHCLIGGGKRGRGRRMGGGGDGRADGCWR